MNADAWLRRHPAVGTAVRRLVCFPHAGGTAGSFAGWAARLPEGTELVAIQYPGRQDRVAEEPMEDMYELADHVAGAMRELLDLPIVLFGHSMGSGLAYEVAGVLQRTDGFVPGHVFVSARQAPHWIAGEHRHRLDDADLVEAMRSLGGPDAEVYDHPALFPLILPPLRADLRLLDRYLPDRLEPLRAPVTALGGDSDATCQVAELSSWADATEAAFRVQVFPGGHHYLREREEAVLGLVREELARHGVNGRGDK